MKTEKYKITLLATFTCDDPSPIEEAWDKDKKICVKQPNGKKYSYDLSKYRIMVIEEILKDE